MKRIHLHDHETGRTRSVTTFGDGVDIARRKSEVEVPEPPPVDHAARMAALRELSQLDPEILAHRERIHMIPFQKLLSALIDQGFFDRLRIDE